MPDAEKKAPRTKVGSIQIDLLLTSDGINVAYAFDGINKDTAIGYLTSVLDRMREERKYEWDTCPECYNPWASHFASDEEEDEYLDEEGED